MPVGDIVFLDRAKETSTTTGSGNIVLGGASDGFVPLSGIGSGNATYYTIEEGSAFEIGRGIYDSVTNSLSRDTIYSSSKDDDSKLDLLGDSTIFITIPATIMPPLRSGLDGNFDSITFASGVTVISGATSSPPTLVINSGNLSFNTGNLDQLLFTDDIVRVGTTAAGEESTSSVGVSIGFYAGGKNEGARNISIGNRVNYGNVSGVYLVGIGDQAGDDSGYNNFSINLGHVAGWNTSGEAQTNLGPAAGYMAKGAYVINVGKQAGQQSAGDHNIYIGRSAGYLVDGTNNIEIVTSGLDGSILTGLSNRLHIENTIIADTLNKKVAIGDVYTGTLLPDLVPNAMLDVVTTGAIGTSIPVFRVAGTGGTLISAIDNTSTGIIFSVSDIAGLPVIAANASGEVILAEYAGQKVGIGTGTPQYQLDVAGTGQFTGGLLLPNGTSIDSSGNATFNNLSVDGTLTYIDSTTVTIADKQLELASNSGSAISGDAYVDDGGIVVKSTNGDKKWTWLDATDAWHSTEHISLASSKSLIFGDGTTQITAATGAGAGVQIGATTFSCNSTQAAVPFSSLSISSGLQLTSGVDDNFIISICNTGIAVDAIQIGSNSVFIDDNINMGSGFVSGVSTIYTSGMNMEPSIVYESVVTSGSGEVPISTGIFTGVSISLDNQSGIRFTSAVSRFQGQSTDFETEVWLRGGSLNFQYGHHGIVFGDNSFQSSAAYPRTVIDTRWLAQENLNYKIENSLDGITGCGLSCTGVTGDFSVDGGAGITINGGDLWLNSGTGYLPGGGIFLDNAIAFSTGAFDSANIYGVNTITFDCGDGEDATIKCYGDGAIDIDVLRISTGGRIEFGCTDATSSDNTYLRCESSGKLSTDGDFAINNGDLWLSSGNDGEGGGIFLDNAITFETGVDAFDGANIYNVNTIRFDCGDGENTVDIACYGGGLLNIPAVKLDGVLEFGCGDGSIAYLQCTGDGSLEFSTNALNIPTGNVYINNTYQTGVFYDIDVENNAYFTNIGINQTNILALIDILSIDVTDIDIRIQSILNQTASFFQIVNVGGDVIYEIDASGDLNTSGDINASGNILMDCGHISGVGMMYFCDGSEIGNGSATFGNLTTTGNLSVSGTLTYIDSTTVTIADKQLELASSSGTPIGNDSVVNDGGIVVKSTDSDKKWTWLDATDAWHSTEHISLASSKSLIFGDGTTQITAATGAGAGVQIGATTFSCNSTQAAVPFSSLSISSGLQLTSGVDDNFIISICNTGIAVDAIQIGSNSVFIDDNINMGSGFVSGVSTIYTSGMNMEPSIVYESVVTSGSGEVPISTGIFTGVAIDLSGESGIRYTAGTHTFYGGSTAFENDVYINKGNLYLNGDTDQNNGCIQFGDGKWQCTSAGALDDIIEWNISTIETSLVGITGCGLSCTGVTGDWNMTSGSLLEVYDVTISDDLFVGDNTFLGTNGGNTINYGTLRVDKTLTIKSGLSVVGSISGDAMNLTGHLAANTKSFLIDHPTKEGKQLQYASLEGPEHGVYVRGYTDANTIPLPDYWIELVRKDSLTVHLTPKDFAQPNLFVSGIIDNTIYLNSDDPISTYYTVNGTRKDVDPLEVEIER